MKEYKKLHLKNDDDSDRLIDHLNQGWELFREFTGWIIVCKDKDASVSPAADLEKPVFRPHSEWFEMLKEPLRSQALIALDSYRIEEVPLSSSMAEAFSAGFSWRGSGTRDKWDGVYDYFDGRTMLRSDSEYCDGYAIATQCAPDGWEQQGAGE